MAGPLSVEDILAKQKAEKEAAAKPKFLSKAERAKIALEKRNAEVQSQQSREEEEKAARIAFERKVEEERRKEEEQRYGGGRGGGGGGYGRGGDGYRREDRYERNGPQNGHGPQSGYGHPQNGRGPQNGHSSHSGHGNAQNSHGPPSGPRGAPTAPRASNGHQAHSSPLAQGAGTGHQAGPSSTPAPSSPRPAVPGDAAQPSDHELAVIKSRYLGGYDFNKKPRAKRETNSKKMNFDWNAADDTTAYDQGSWRTEVLNAVPGAVMLGGRLAGFDEGGQRRGQTAVDDKHADALERRRAGKGNNDDRHWTDKPLEEMKDRDWRIFREDFSISARGGAIPLPLRSWRESTISPKILDIIDEIGYESPSPIQRQAIPIGLQNRDLVGLAKTGSGKTAAFAIPMIEYISRLPPIDDNNKDLGPYALILAPTRELAQQIDQEVRRFANPLGFRCVSIVGGKSVDAQVYELRLGAHVVVATPGRLKDMLEGNKLVLSQCRYTIMDECDRMIDLGFEVDLNIILDAMPSTSREETGDLSQESSMRITTLFSATMPPAVERISRKYLRKPAYVTIGQAGEAVDTVSQQVEFIYSEAKKQARLIEILRSGQYPAPIIVFVNQKRTADQVIKHVYSAGRSAVTLSSDKTQDAREEAVQMLRDGNVEVLVATDVAGRGLDIPDVSLVVNWQMPSDISRYTHRIGRTGRAGKLGTAISFLEETDEEVFYDLKQLISQSSISTMNPELARHQAAQQRLTKEMKRKRDESDR